MGFEGFPLPRHIRGHIAVTELRREAKEERRLTWFSPLTVHALCSDGVHTTNRTSQDRR